MKFLLKLFKRRKIRECYVVIYDTPDEEEGEIREEYYGYFSSPEEAARLWNAFKGPGLAEDIYQNVKLCRVIEDW